VNLADGASSVALSIGQMCKYAGRLRARQPPRARQRYVAQQGGIPRVILMCIDPIQLARCKSSNSMMADLPNSINLWSPENTKCFSLPYKYVEKIFASARIK